VNLKSHI